MSQCLHSHTVDILSVFACILYENNRQQFLVSIVIQWKSFFIYFFRIETLVIDPRTIPEFIGIFSLTDLRMFTDCVWLSYRQSVHKVSFVYGNISDPFYPHRRRKWCLLREGIVSEILPSSSLNFCEHEYRRVVKQTFNSTRWWHQMQQHSSDYYYSSNFDPYFYFKKYRCSSVAACRANAIGRMSKRWIRHPTLGWNPSWIPTWIESDDLSRWAVN